MKYIGHPLLQAHAQNRKRNGTITGSKNSIVSIVEVRSGVL